ncbi:hypothetical protein BANRA_05476 [Escherichia coli]|uniref:Uncharacterized protein n=1 Tax=Escherichia coli TaxID=562 RepID=A0A3P5HEH8_ECOLX|nr:hypothetical protein BANRA_05476 [Escherichia coli]
MSGDDKLKNIVSGTLTNQSRWFGLPLDELIPQQSVLAGVSQHRNICSVLVQRFWFISGLKTEKGQFTVT